MIKKIRLMLEYNTYCIWLYDENDEIIDNDNPPEWDDDETLTQAFMSVSDLYDTFYIDNGKEFRYVGCPDQRTREKLNKILSERTGQPIETIEKDTERDHYMTAEEAKEYGLIDEVMDNINNIKESK